MGIATVLNGVAGVMMLTSATVSEAAAPSFSIPHSQVIDLPTSANGIDYQIYVHVPPACGEQSRCPVVYALDAEYSFAIASIAGIHLSDRNRIPPVITVSIGYPDKSHYRRDRSRDYTPYFDADSGYGVEYQRDSGGGPAFLAVIRDEIIPYVEGRFPAARAPRTIVGHSYGGLFATYAWMTEPDIFDQYIIVSPSLWYAESRPLDDLETVCAEAPFAEERALYLAVGEFEEQPENGRTMVSDLRRMEEILQHCSSRNAVSLLRVFENETHASIFPAAFSAGLRAHFQ